MIYTFLLFSVFSFLVASQTTVNLTSYSATISDSIVLSQSWLPYSGYYPDGRINMLYYKEKYYGFWSEFANSRTSSTSSHLSDHISKLSPSYTVFGSRNSGSSWSSNGLNDGGSWMVGVNRLSDGRWITSFHGESRWTASDSTAYMSVGTAYSSNAGVSWTNVSRILKSEDKPSTAKWSGIGNGCFIYDVFNKRWLSYYTPGSLSTICVAQSLAEDPVNGTWYKWNGSSFSNEGWGGKDVSLKNLNSVAGANPDVHWSSYLGKWVMVWHAWSKNTIIWISTSSDAVNWETPQALFSESGALSYPTILGDDYDTVGQNVLGKTAIVYYSADMVSDGKRSMKYRSVTFQL